MTPDSARLTRTPPLLALRTEASPASLPVIRAEVDRVARDLLNPDRRLDVSIAVSEAATNAVLHAYPGVAPPGEVRVAVWRDDRRLVVEIADDGRGFTPGDRSVRSGLRLGLPLMSTLADEMRCVSGGHGTRVTMCFCRRAAPGLTD